MKKIYEEFFYPELTRNPEARQNLLFHRIEQQIAIAQGSNKFFFLFEFPAITFVNKQVSWVPSREYPEVFREF